MPWITTSLLLRVVVDEALDVEVHVVRPAIFRAARTPGFSRPEEERRRKLP